MVINTKEISSRIKLGVMLISLVLVALIAMSLVFIWSKNHVFEYTVGIIYLVFMIFIFVKNYCYIYYVSDGPKIILRYIPLKPLSAGNFSIEIPKKDFVKVELKERFFGLSKKLIFYVKSTKGVAKFKPVSVSILSKKQLNDLMADLTRIS